MLFIQIFEYYDSRMKKYKCIIDNENQMNLSNADNNSITLFNLVKKDTQAVILQGSIFDLGRYDHIYKLWIWAWSLPHNHSTLISKKLLAYAQTIDIDDNDMFAIKAELLNSKLYIDDPYIEIEKYIALSMYLTKSDYYISKPHYDDGKLIYTDYFLQRDIVKMSSTETDNISL